MRKYSLRNPIDQSRQEVELMLQKILKKNNPYTFRTINTQTYQDYNALSEQELKIMTRRGIDSQRMHSNDKIPVINTIKGRPYCLKLGKIQSKIDNFQGFYETFFTNVYKDPKKVVKPVFSFKKNPRKRKLKLDKNITTTLSTRPGIQTLTKHSESNEVRCRLIHASKPATINFSTLITDCDILLKQKKKRYKVDPISRKSSLSII